MVRVRGSDSQRAAEIAREHNPELPGPRVSDSNRVMRKLIFVTALLFSIQTFAWGPVGHRAVGLIADDQLTPQAKREVAKLLGRENLGDVANWADEIKSGRDYKQTTWYHFEKIPDHVSYIENLEHMSERDQKRGGVMAAILLSEKLLRSPKTSAADKAVALKFLAHFVGDLHQPLHSGRPEDKGGVLIEVEWFGEHTSLHGVWDSRMIKTGHADLFRRQAARRDDGATYADYLKEKFKGSKVGTGIDIERWLGESMAARPAAYVTTYLSDQARYQRSQLEVVDERIHVAGIRLGAMVNEIFSGRPRSSAHEDLHKRIEDVVGDLDSMVNYNP